MDARTPDMSAREAVTGRKSVRGFLSNPVPRDTIEAILSEAARAPSGTNAQPWQVHVVAGAARDRLVRAVVAAAEVEEKSQEYRYYPDDWFEPYLSRRRKVGYDLYGLLGIARQDWDRRKAQHIRNFELFDAPVGLFFVMDRRLAQGSWLDTGMFIANVMTLARAHGLETCPQASWLTYGAVVHRELAIPDDRILLCGMALGRPDWDVPANALETERAALADFTTFHTS